MSLTDITLKSSAWNVPPAQPRKCVKSLCPGSKITSELLITGHAAYISFLQGRPALWELLFDGGKIMYARSIKTFSSAKEIMEWWSKNAQGKQIGVLLNGHKRIVAENR